MISLQQKRRLLNFTETYVEFYHGTQARYVTFIVTHACNLKCSYCYEHSKSDKRMTLEVAKKCVDILFESDAQNSPYINDTLMNGIVLDFIGGEPLIEIDLIDEIATYFLDQAILRNHRWATRYMLSMTSNGMLYFDPKVKRFLDKYNGRVNISITVDGDKETHDTCRVDCNGCGSYDKASAAFSDAKNRYGQIGTKFTIAPENVDRVFIACKDIIERHDLSILHCNCVYEEGWNESHAKVLYYELKKLADWIIATKKYEYIMLSIFDESIGHKMLDADNQNWCGGTGKMLAFDVDGTVYPCIRYAPLSMNRRPLIRLGDSDNGIANLKEDKDTIDMLNSITRKSQSTDECINCPIGSGCGWCSAHNYESLGSVNKRATFICPTHKARCLAASYYWNNVYKLLGETTKFEMNVPAEWAIPIIGEDEYNMLVNLAK